MFGVLAQGLVTRRAVTPAETVRLPGRDRGRTVPGAGQGAALSRRRGSRHCERNARANVGVECVGGAHRLVYIPGAAAVTGRDCVQRLPRADVVLFDGTLFTDDEMIAHRHRRKDRPPHGPHADRRRRRLARGARRTSPARRIYVHINNTNPILVDGSPERATSKRAGLGGRLRRHGDRAVKPMMPDELEAALREIGARALPPPAPVPRAAARRPMHQGPSAGLGAQPLLLPGDDPGEGREPHCTLRRSRHCAANGEAASPTTTASATGEGGIARWLTLTDGLGLDRGYVVSLAGLLPATRFAVEAYVHFVREKSLLEAVASSLTELFSPQIIGERVEGMLKGYAFVSADTLAYFSKRPPLARRDAISRSITPSTTPRRQTRSRPCSRRLNSSATCYGRCWTRSTTPMWRPSTCPPAPSCRRIRAFSATSHH